jgi:hypothetical protein
MFLVIKNMKIFVNIEFGREKNPLYFFDEIINFIRFSNEMKKVKIGFFYSDRKKITLSPTTFDIPTQSVKVTWSGRLFKTVDKVIH